ncbi:MAG: hypothetical protein ACK4TG_06075, partial [Thermaurantiacus sp.]
MHGTQKSIRGRVRGEDLDDEVWFLHQWRPDPGQLFSGIRVCGCANGTATSRANADTADDTADPRANAANHPARASAAAPNLFCRNSEVRVRPQPQS